MTHSIIFMLRSTAVTIGHVFQDLFQSLAAYRKKHQQNVALFYCMSFITVAWQRHTTAAVLTLHLMFSPWAWHLRKTHKKNALGDRSKRIFVQAQQDGEDFFFPPTSSDLVLPSSCRGVSCWRWQLHRIMTHASCACQTSPDSRVRGSVIHGAVFTALGGMSQAFRVKWSACWTSIFKSSHIFFYFYISNFSLLGRRPFKCLNVYVYIWVFKIGWNQTLWQCRFAAWQNRW